MTTLTVPCAILPAELLLIIKDYIPISDLRTHVCYYHTCCTVASFYGDNSQQADFWRRSCSLSGLGWLKGDSSWKEIAFETIAKDGFCLHPACGGALLDWNGTCSIVSSPAVPHRSRQLSKSHPLCAATTGIQRMGHGMPRLRRRLPWNGRVKITPSPSAAPPSSILDTGSNHCLHGMRIHTMYTFGTRI